jgi:hypothetical protein
MTARCGTSSAPGCIWMKSADPAVLAGPQVVAGIREQSRHPDGAGPDVHLAIREVEGAFLRIDRPVRQNELESQLFLSRLSVPASVAAVKSRYSCSLTVK